MDENYNTYEKAEEKKVKVELFKCSSCGNNLEYSPETHNLKCPSCGSEFEIENVTKVSENAFTKDSIVENVDESIAVFRCENCGAVSEKPNDGISFTCPYCKKTNVVLDEELKGIKPDGVVPFAISARQCKEKMKEWLKGKFFAPGKVKKIRIDYFLSGMYSPCFTFDSHTYSTYEGRIGKRHTVTTGSGKNRTTHTVIRYKNISGNCERIFDDVKVSASADMKDKDFSQIAYYDTNNACGYKREFLTGFSAVHNQKSLKDSWFEGKKIIDKGIEEAILSQYNYDVVDYLNVGTNYQDCTYKYLLLPFWYGKYSYNGKSYNVLANGVSGKITGAYPKSVPKIILVSLLAGLAIFGLIRLLMVM